MKKSQAIDIKSKLELLKNSGHRLTNTRKATLAIFASTKHPLSAQEIITELESRKLKVNKTTVYRELDFLLAQKLIRELDLMEGKKRYEIVTKDDHHHHLICRLCSLIQCVEMPGDLSRIEKQILKEHKFIVQDHILEFFGVCENCSN